MSAIQIVSLAFVILLGAIGGLLLCEVVAHGRLVPGSSSLALQKKVDAFLERHQVDIGRCLAVVLFAWGLESLLTLVLAAAAFPSIVRFEVIGAIAGLFLWMLAMTYAQLHLGALLWRHRPLGRKIVIVLAIVGLVISLVFAAAGPLLPAVTLKVAGYKNTHPGIVEKFVVGLVGIAAFGMLIAVLLSNRCKQEFGVAQPGATDNPDDAQRLREDH